MNALKKLGLWIMNVLDNAKPPMKNVTCLIKKRDAAENTRHVLRTVGPIIQTRRNVVGNAMTLFPPV
jgi:hypothetical protein